MAGVRCKNISKNFGPVRALNNCTLDIPDGTFCVVLGPSGCGKSTLLNIIAGLESPTSGSLIIGARDVTNVPPHKRDIAMVFQNYALYPHLSVFENMAFGLRVRGEKRETIKEKVRDAAHALGIEDKLNELPGRLSGGQRQRVATGRAIVRDPALFLFDEPLSNLDARLRLELRGELIKLHRRLRKTMIYVTHDQVEAMVLGESVIVIRDGVVQQVSDPKRLYYDPRNLFVAEFIGSPPMNLIEGVIVQEAGALFFEKSSFRYELHARHGFMKRYLKERVFFGIRPSCVKIEDSPLKGSVSFVEMIDEESFVHILFGDDAKMTVRTDGANDPEPGDTVPARIDLDRAFFFGTDGTRIKG